MRKWVTFILICLAGCFAVSLSACSVSVNMPSDTGAVGNPSGGESARVTRVIDGDTIEVEMNGVGYRVRYIGMNTPESNEPCFAEATAANAALVSGKTVTLVKDTSNTDRYGRLLRYVYVGGNGAADDFVNADLVRDGWAENAEYPPDTEYAATFRQLEAQAAAANIGCHPTGIFDDGSATR